MTAQYIILQLLRLGALRFHEIVVCTGWQTKRVRQTLAGLREAGKVQHSGVYGGEYSL
jgi:hypothetical protein